MEDKPKEAPVTPKTPKSPAKSEPPTPSKKMKEVMPIPTFELGLVLAAGQLGMVSQYTRDVQSNVTLLR